MFFLFLLVLLAIFPPFITASDIPPTPKNSSRSQTIFPNVTAVFPKICTPLGSPNDTTQPPYRKTLEKFVGNIEAAAAAIYDGFYSEPSQIRVLSLEDLKWILYRRLDNAAKQAFEKAIKDMHLSFEYERWALEELDQAF